MSISHHPSEASLLAFAGGTTKPAVSVVIATHLTFCNACAETVAFCETIGGALLGMESDAAMTGDALARTLAAIDRAATGAKQIIVDLGSLPGGFPCPPPIQPYLRGSWRWIAPGMRRMRLLGPRTEGGALDLYRISPGAGLPQHGHRGSEFTCVISGSFTDSIGHFSVGDLAEIDQSVEHRQVADQNRDCVCLVASEQPIKPHTILSKMMQPILRF